MDVPDCVYHGRVSDMIEHLQGDPHSMDVLPGYEVSRDTHPTADEHYFSRLLTLPDYLNHAPFCYDFLLSAFDRHFLIVFHDGVDRNLRFYMLYAAVQLIGTPTDARKYQYQ